MPCLTYTPRVPADKTVGEIQKCLTVRTLWNTGSTPANHLVICSQAGLEQSFDEVGGDEEIDTATFIERGMSVAQPYHLEIVGPPLG